MVIFKLKATAKSKPWLEKHKIDIRAIEIATTLLFSELENTTGLRKKTIIIQIMHGADSSDYTFTTNKIRLCEPNNNTKSQRQRKLALFSHYLHEFRHWMQSQVYKISGTKLSYDDEDVERNSHAYYRNEYEVDARQFERTHLAKFYKYYKHFENSNLNG